MGQHPKIIIEEQNHIQILSLIGRVTFDSIAEYRDNIQHMLKPSRGHIIDLSGVEQIDSSGIGLIVGIAKQFMDLKEPMIIVIQDDFLLEIFKISKLTKIFRIEQTLEKALFQLENN